MRLRLMVRRGVRPLAVLVAGISAAALMVAGQGVAVAADTVRCGPKASVFAADSNGALWQYPLNSPGGSTASFSARTKIGTGWQTYGRILGGPGGRLYGINSTGLYRYRWTGSAWESVAGNARQQLSPSFTSYATAARRNQITVDERGDFYLIDGDGKLRWYRYDETTKAWTIFGRVIDNGWGSYDLLIAGGKGVLYARAAADGKFYRYRFEPDSQRWIDRNVHVGVSWSTFSKGIFSAGGDTLFGIRGDGRLLQYRYREDSGGWPVQARQIGTDWQGFANVTATTDTCSLTVSHTPARPAIGFAKDSPVRVLQPTLAGGQTALSVKYAYVNNIGWVVAGHQTDRDNFNSIQWMVISGNEAFTGLPALSQQPDGTVQVAALRTDGDIWATSQTSAGAATWKAWSDLGGRMVSPPVVAQLSDNTQVAFAADANGTLWAAPQDRSGGELMAWRRLGGTGLTGAPVTVPVANARAAVFAYDANGTLQMATYHNGSISSWTSMGGTSTGTPAVVVYPGYRLRVFVRGADGVVLTKQQDAAGNFPAAWDPVGTFVPVGAPAAILDPVLGRTAIVARGQDNRIWRSWETAQGSGVFGDWAEAIPEVNDPTVTEPSVAPLTNANGQTWVIVFRNLNGTVRVYDRGPLSAGAGLTPVPDVSFAATSLVMPPE